MKQVSVGLLGKKLGMSRVYDEAGVATTVTVIAAEPNVVTQVKTKEKEGYSAVQLGFQTQKESRLTKPVAGHFKKAGVAPKSFLREFLCGTEDVFKVGDEIKVDRFKVGQLVDVIGVSKGKGFQGVIRKHNFAGQPAAHGSKTHRRNGSIGQRSTPGRVFKNMGMPGHMGDDRNTVQNLPVIQVRTEDNALLVKGAIPGAKGSLVVIRTAIKGQPRPKKITVQKSVNPMKQSKAKK
jgi:large subunit ribosomal protein L3